MYFFTEPIVIKPLEHRSIKEGHSSTLICEFSVPNVNSQWYRNGKPIDTRGRYRTEVNERIHKLTIQDVRTEDQGKYTCRYEHLETTAELVIEGSYVQKKIIFSCNCIYSRHGVTFRRHYQTHNYSVTFFFTCILVRFFL